MTGLVERLGRVLVVAPHPDDEVLGCGGVLALLADAGNPGEVAIVTAGQPPRYDAAHLAAIAEETRAAHAILGVAAVHQLGLPAAALDTVPHATVNGAFAALFEAVRPDTLFIPFNGDIHLDHQIVFASSLVAARPAGPTYPVRILAYETLSETNWNAPGMTPGFIPNVFVEITATLDRKLAAFAAYASQVRSFPAERSPEALQALARLRGSTVHRHAAEAFMLIREVG